MQGSSPKYKVSLTGSLTIEKAIEIKRELSAALASASLVMIDLSSVEDIDLACLQAVYAARAEATAQGKELHFEGTIPQRVAKRLSACGFLRGSPPVGAEEFEAALVDF
jgi:anti-anti-sigma regulatory factor